MFYLTHVDNLNTKSQSTATHKTQGLARSYWLTDWLTDWVYVSIRHGYSSPDINLADIIDTAHDTQFQQVLNDPNHVLDHVLPNRISSQYNYNLRTRQHDRQLYLKCPKSIIILLFVCCTKMYWLFCISYYYSQCMFMMRSVIVLLNEYDWLNEWLIDWMFNTPCPEKEATA